MQYGSAEQKSWGTISISAIAVMQYILVITAVVTGTVLLVKDIKLFNGYPLGKANF